MKTLVHKETSTTIEANRHRTLGDDHNSACFTHSLRVSDQVKLISVRVNRAQLENHPRWPDLQLSWLIIPVKTAECGYDLGRERERERK